MIISSIFIEKLSVTQMLTNIDSVQQVHSFVGGGSRDRV